MWLGVGTTTQEEGRSAGLYDSRLLEGIMLQSVLY